MCKNAFEKLSERTNKIMIFCKLRGCNTDLSNLCMCQRFCNDKDRYVETDQKKNCKYYED